MNEHIKNTILVITSISVTLVIFIILNIEYKNHNFKYSNYNKIDLIKFTKENNYMYMDENFNKYDEHEISINHESNVLPIIVLNTNICPGCINNIFEYGSVFEELSLYNLPILVFVNSEEFEIKRFIGITGLNYPVFFSSVDLLDPIMFESNQKILFVDIKEEVVFFDLLIPSVTVTKDFIDQTLQVAANEWVYFKDSITGE